MTYIKAYFRNLGLILGVVVFMLVFARIFYPDVLSALPLIGQVYSGLNLWPFIILSLLIFALPRRRSRR